MRASSADRSNGRARPRRFRSASTWCDRATASASSTRSAPPASRTPGFSAFQAAIDHDTAVADDALALIQQHVDRYAAEDFFPIARRARRAPHVSEAAAGPLRAAVGNARPRAARPDVPGVSAIFSRVVRDFYHKYTVDEHTLLTIRNLEAPGDAVDAEPRPLQRAAGRARRTRSCWCSRSSTTTSANGRDDDHSVESVRMARQMFERLDLAGRIARHRRIPHPEPPQDVAGRVPPRHRGSGHRQALRRAGRASRSA